MEKNGNSGGDPAAVSSYSWWWDSHNNRPHQSQWLHSTLSDLDKKVKMMLKLIEEEGDTFAERAEMYYQKKPELIKMVEDLHRSYCALADKYDQLRPDSIRFASSSFGSSTNSFSVLQKNSHKNDQNNPDSEALSDHAIVSEKKVLVTDKCKKKMNGTGNGIDIQVVGLLEKEKMWDALRIKVAELVEENLRQQAELVRRNEEKRKAIMELMNENLALKSCLARSKVVDDPYKKQLIQTRIMSKMKGKFFC